MELTTKKDSSGQVTAVCLDAETERKMQQQRQFAMLIGGPAIVAAGCEVYEERPLFGLFVAGLGLACSIWHYTAYKAVDDLL